MSKPGETKFPAAVDWFGCVFRLLLAVVVIVELVGDIVEYFSHG